MTMPQSLMFDDDIDNLVSWWRERNGLFVDLDNVLMKVVMQSKPSRTVGRPVPLLVGSETLTARLLGSTNPKLLSLNIKQYFPQFVSETFEDYLHAADTFEPTLSLRCLTTSTSEGPVDVTYQRLLLPVRPQVGAEAILTYSLPVQLH